MYKIFKTENGVNKMCVGRASTVKKCVEIISEFIDAHNDGVIFERPCKKYLHTVGDINAQVEAGKVRAYIHDVNCSEWYNKKMCDNKITCDIGAIYAYHRRGLTTKISVEDNCDVVYLSNYGQVVFNWIEV